MISLLKALFISMVREEWRVHTTAFGNRYYGVFPLVIGIITCIGSLFVPFLLRVVTIDQLFLSAHYIFLLFGVSVGAFGLFGKEIMNRRFGQASLIAYSARSLPVGERAIFLVFFLKDVVFYLFLWIAPIFVGLVVSASFIGFSYPTVVTVCGTFFLSFLLGLSLIFLLSTIYAHSSRLIVVVLLVVVLTYFSVDTILGIDGNFLLAAYNLYYSQSVELLLMMVLFIVLAAAISIAFVKIEYPEAKRHYSAELSGFIERFRFSSLANFLAKDFIDLKRSEGGLGKIIFSFLMPVAFTYLFLEVFLDLIPDVKGIMIFAVFLGIVSASIYNMLTAFDTFNPYMFLPVRVSTVLKSKIQSFLLFNILSVVVLVLAAVSMQQIDYLIPAFLMFVSICVYSLAVTIYLTGLHPNVLMYNSRVFIPYIGLLGSVLFLATFFSIIDPFVMVVSPILLPVAYLLLKKSFQKWDKWIPQTI